MTSILDLTDLEQIQQHLQNNCSNQRTNFVRAENSCYYVNNKVGYHSRDIDGKTYRAFSAPERKLNDSLVQDFIVNKKFEM